MHTCFVCRDVFPPYFAQEGMLTHIYVHLLLVLVEDDNVWFEGSHTDLRWNCATASGFLAKQVTMDCVLILV